MTPEEKLYTLMAHAEDLQSHAQTLQSRAQTAFDNLPNVVWDVERRFREQATRWILLCTVIVLALGVVAAAGVSAYIRHDVGSLQAKADALRGEIAEMEQAAAELEGKTWRLKLAHWEDERGIILPRGVKVDRTGPLKDGREAIVIKP